MYGQQYEKIDVGHYCNLRAENTGHLDMLPPGRECFKQ